MLINIYYILKSDFFNYTFAYILKIIYSLKISTHGHKLSEISTLPLIIITIILNVLIFG